mgnify:CR=1 FL=1
MKRNVMRTMSLAFAGIMAAGALTACGGNNTAATTAAPAEQTSAAGESAAEEATAAPAKEGFKGSYGVCIRTIQLDTAR